MMRGLSSRNYNNGAAVQDFRDEYGIEISGDRTLHRGQPDRTVSIKPHDVPNSRSERQTAGGINVVVRKRTCAFRGPIPKCPTTLPQTI
jgi:hypothetical protein